MRSAAVKTIGDVLHARINDPILTFRARKKAVRLEGSDGAVCKYYQSSLCAVERKQKIYHLVLSPPDGTSDALNINEESSVTFHRALKIPFKSACKPKELRVRIRSPNGSYCRTAEQTL